MDQKNNKNFHKDAINDISFDDEIRNKYNTQKNPFSAVSSAIEQSIHNEESNEDNSNQNTKAVSKVENKNDIMTKNRTVASKSIDNNIDLIMQEINSYDGINKSENKSYFPSGVISNEMIVAESNRLGTNLPIPSHKVLDPLEFLDSLNSSDKLLDKPPKVFDINKCSLQNLAYIGDAVMSLHVRTKLCKSEKYMHMGDMVKAVNVYVCATSQSNVYLGLFGIMNEEEKNIAKRGRNKKTGNKAKNASINEYRRASGFEAVIGYLYLIGKTKRMEELLEKAMKLIDNMDKFK